MCTHTRAPASKMSRCHGIAADLCLGTCLAEDSRVCAGTHAWHVCGHGHGVRAGVGVCASLGPRMEGWHSWGTMWSPGWQGETHVLLCDAEPPVFPVPPMPLASPLLPVLPAPPPCPQAYSENMGQAMSRSALCRARWKVTPSSS